MVRHTCWSKVLGFSTGVVVGELRDEGEQVHLSFNKEAAAMQTSRLSLSIAGQEKSFKLEESQF